ncbi:transcription factor bHLH94-like [Argentina anserina]|uniref:transcription factor bHLH94-like n=1 Tax=Argentina anserina TaxID=57926 RepID=UPI0021763A83|nr:transcription factor bHLH94-like [Potentilla anserina]
MALDAVVFPRDPYTSNKDIYNLLVGSWSYDDDHENHHHQQQLLQEASFDFLGNQTDHHFASYCSTPSMVPHFDELQLSNPNPDGLTDFDQSQFQCPSAEDTGQTTTARPKRRRAKSKKNREEIENQRMTHIAVERNRRKQMNEYLSALRSIMPDSYVQRGDQASIIGGAINFVKELEQQVQLLGAQKQNDYSSDLPFSDFFSFPQYSSSTASSSTSTAHQTSHENRYDSDQTPFVDEPKYAADMNVRVAAAADIEVTMVDSHANLKVRSKRVPKQLLKFVSGLHTLRLTILHLNISTVDDIVLYSLSVKVEEDCALNSVDEIATAVYQILARIQEEAMLLFN